MSINNRWNNIDVDTQSVGSDVDGIIVPRSGTDYIVAYSGTDRNQKANHDHYANLNNIYRRKSSVEKSDELATVRIEALNQLENTIQMADIIDNKNAKIASLQTEIKSLKMELKQMRRNSIESRRINDELMEQLQIMSNTSNRHKIELENIRTTEMSNAILEAPLTSDPSYSRYLKDIIDNREKLIEENDRLQRKITDQQSQIEKLNSYVMQLEAAHKGHLTDYKYIDETTIDDRSKADLLKLIRTQMDDKMVWMEYSIKLTQEAVLRHPDLLNIDCKDGDDEEQSVDKVCAEERKWSKFAISILRNVVRICPQLLSEICESADQYLIRYLKSRL